MNYRLVIGAQGGRPRPGSLSSYYDTVRWGRAPDPVQAVGLELTDKILLAGSSFGDTINQDGRPDYVVREIVNPPEQIEKFFPRTDNLFIIVIRNTGIETVQELGSAAPTTTGRWGFTEAWVEGVAQRFAEFREALADASA